MINFQREKGFDLWDEIQPLIQEHWEEVAHYKDIPMQPDVRAYNALERSGKLRVYTARSNQTLIGYVVYFLINHLHYMSSVQAIQDVIFLNPEHRHGSLGWRMIKFSEDELRKDGAEVVQQHVKARHNFGKMLERNGYEIQDLIYTKRL